MLRSAILLVAAVAVVAAVPLQSTGPTVHEIQAAFDFHYSLTVNVSNGAYTMRPEPALSPNERFDRMLKRGSRAFNFFPAFRGTAIPNSGVATWQASCFADTTAVVEINGTDSATIYVRTRNEMHTLCKDMYLIANEENAYVRTYLWPGSHVLHLTNLTPEEVANIKAFGLHFFEVEDGMLGSLADVIDTAKLFFGKWSEEDSRQFVADRMGLEYADRTAGLVNLKEEDIPSGTFLSTQRFDGSEVMIQYGTGATVGHSTIATRLNGTLHVCESTDKNSPAYWPPPYGIICTPWAQWIDLAVKADYAVTLIPLADEQQKLYDEKKAEAFVESVRGMPYGYHNFLWGWYDTVNSNFPPPFSSQILGVGFSLFDKIKPNITRRVFLAGANMRLQTECESFDCIMAALAKTNMTIEEMLTMPEKDEWTYYDGKSMVCNVFVLETMKAAGVFGDVVFQATELTPRDLYTLHIFNSTKLPGCLDDGQPMCQIMGKWQMSYTGFNSIVPYNNMCERCPTVWPHYERPEGC